MIKVRHVTKSYGEGDNLFTALDDVTFSVPIGASVAIVGKSGSGKSTLLHIMSGLDQPQQGEVIVDNQNILRMKRSAVDRFRSQHIGFIFQSFQGDAQDTCYQNVSLVCEIADVSPAKHHRRIVRALEDVELAEKKDQRACDLSGGEQQRLAIARAIASKPKILFADEPTGNLDSVTGKLIEDLLFRYNREKGVTLVLVTHDQDLAKRCDATIHIADGKVIETAADLDKGSKKKGAAT
jgi:putative ABC transport system ATP-binding protein